MVNASWTFEVGVWLIPQHTSVDHLREGWRAADSEVISCVLSVGGMLM